jgi:two-component system NtrC family response regulator
VRELENLARRTSLLARGPSVTAADLDPGVTVGESVDLSSPCIRLPKGGIDLQETEKAIVVEALRVCDGNKAAAARFLGIPRHVLIYRMQKYEL